MCESTIFLVVDYWLESLSFAVNTVITTHITNSNYFIDCIIFFVRRTKVVLRFIAIFTC